MAYNYSFGHSCSVGAAEVASSLSKFSVSINHELMNNIAASINELHTESLNDSALFEKKSRIRFADFTVYSFEDYRPGGGAGGCKTNNACTRVHVALNGQVSCLPCIFNTG